MLLRKRIGADSVIFLFLYSPGEKLGEYHDLLGGKTDLSMCLYGLLTNSFL